MVELYVVYNDSLTPRLPDEGGREGMQNGHPKLSMHVLPTRSEYQHLRLRQSFV